MANLYFNEQLDAAAFAAGALVELTGDEARHAVRVSRLRIGERILVGDGAGTIAEGVVESTDRDRFSVRIGHTQNEAAPAQRLVLVQALAKGDRDERAVEQATEFGVDVVIPWEASRSVSRWGSEKAEKGLSKWAKIAREASKQSLRARVPELRAPLTIAGLCTLAAEPGIEVVALHPRGGERLRDWAASPDARAAREILVVVGPEGGFDDAELDRLEQAGAIVRKLGDTVLRTSSAGPAALAVLNSLLGRW